MINDKISFIRVCNKYQKYSNRQKGCGSQNHRVLIKVLPVNPDNMLSKYLRGSLNLASNMPKGTSLSDGR